MSLSKPKPQFNFDVLYYLNRDQLEHFSIVCRPLENFIERYFHSKPYRYLGRLEIRGGLYALFNHRAQWHPNRDDYTAQQFLGHKHKHHQIRNGRNGSVCIFNMINQIFSSIVSVLFYFSPSLTLTSVLMGGNGR